MFSQHPASSINIIGHRSLNDYRYYSFGFLVIVAVLVKTHIYIYIYILCRCWRPCSYLLAADSISAVLAR